MKRSRFHITDHAIVRYLERVKGIDMVALRAEIAVKVEAAEEHPGCAGVVSGGFTYKLQGDSVCTVVQASRPDQRTGRSTTRGKRK